MQTNKLRRVLGFWDVFFIAVGQIIGAGVVALTGIAIGMTGPSVILAYFFAGILVLIVAIPIMIAGTSLPATGAYYTWSSRSRRRLAGLYCASAHSPRHYFAQSLRQFLWPVSKSLTPCVVG